MKASVAVPAFVAFGFAGWLLENVYREKPAFSKAFGGAKVPFLPVYAIGGLSVLLLSEKIKDYEAWQRFIIYAAATTGVEFVAGQIDRMDGKKPSWDYDGAVVNLGYSLMWAGAALAIEKARA